MFRPLSPETSANSPLIEAALGPGPRFPPAHDTFTLGDKLSSVRNPHPDPLIAFCVIGITVAGLGTRHGESPRDATIAREWFLLCFFPSKGCLRRMLELLRLALTS